MLWQTINESEEMKGKKVDWNFDTWTQTIKPLKGKNYDLFNVIQKVEYNLIFNLCKTT